MTARLTPKQRQQLWVEWSDRVERLPKRHGGLAFIKLLRRHRVARDAERVALKRAVAATKKRENLARKIMDSMIVRHEHGTCSCGFPGGKKCVIADLHGTIG